MCRESTQISGPIFKQCINKYFSNRFAVNTKSHFTESHCEATREKFDAGKFKLPIKFNSNWSWFCTWIKFFKPTLPRGGFSRFFCLSVPCLLSHIFRVLWAACGKISLVNKKTSWHNFPSFFFPGTAEKPSKRYSWILLFLMVYYAHICVKPFCLLVVVASS